IVELDEWKAEFVEPSSAEQILFKDLPSGTLVTLKKIDKLQYKSLNYLVTKVVDEFSEIFRKYLAANVSIKVNDGKLIPADPLEINNEKTEILFDDDIDFKENTMSVKLVLLE